MQSEEIRKSFLEFFRTRGHAVVPSSSLVPDDPSVLLTTAGMQQFKRYFTGEMDAKKDYGSASVVSVQKCFRTSDIDEVGDKTHLTFFEMLGNFSFGLSGQGGKKEAIQYAHLYLTEILGINPERITVTVFAGDNPPAGGVPYDSESFDVWHKDIGLAADKISKHDRKDNFWGPTGNEGPCGPTTEIYVDGVEVWNLVFNQYYQQKDKTLEKLKTSGVDTGMGFERLTAMLQGVEDVFATDLFEPLIKKINETAPHLKDREVRIIADHLRSSVFLAADGVRPSNKEAGYILRRLLRRVLAYQVLYDIHGDILADAAKIVKEKFGAFYPEVANPEILEVLESERDKFQRAIALGIKELPKYKTLTAKDAFYLYETFGLPWELIAELAPAAAKNLVRKDFEEEFSKHQEISRAGVEKKFGGHGLLLDTGELKAKDENELNKVVRLHTATHLLQAALRKVLGNEVQQRGSDITAERTRFDFAFPRKLTAEEIKKAEILVNEIIEKDLPVQFKEMPKEEAAKTGALYFFKEKYPDKVKVYYVGRSLGDAFSKEFCGGPHVSNTLVIGKFKIAKEEAVGSGVRRIRATVGGIE
ncbi:MAG: Alanine-tRNA ligase [Candidatus Giovannonibacteria bacterium GW2011_GWB1_47_6b]|uniref:alanine--tRNA ligase n=1 Tax=Candidatus Giovannonibacteria bacterium GW2011_GWB1_47_6b TaxID=1618655 RepID=A0A0G1VGB2_9BACT|nr:MAG: Alanine-tRNA ligase [Candidatus Giovannonibacteria bacterium GW2011_GWB1_47_6b]